MRPIIAGQDGADSILGGRGDDRLKGGDRIDIMDGGRDRDTAHDDSENYDILPPIHCEIEVII